MAARLLLAPKDDIEKKMLKQFTNKTLSIINSCAFRGIRVHRYSKITIKKTLAPNYWKGYHSCSFAFTMYQFNNNENAKEKERDAWKNNSNERDLFDRKQFEKKFKLVALVIPAQKSSLFMKELKGHLFTKRKMKSIVSDPSIHKEQRLVLLNEQYKTVNDLPANILAFIKQQLLSPSSYIEDKYTIELSTRNYEITVGYEQLSSDEILQALLPKELRPVIPSAFEQVGHIAHLNLRDELLPYKYLIGQVILDKSPMIKTVVNKIGMIESVYREAHLEVLAGEPNFNVDMKEHGIRFVFNFSEVYWNSRLASEHQRILKYFKKGDTICDMMAGVGPFAIPAAKKLGIKVYANDLNPKSYEYMVKNVKLNKVDSLVKCYNMDGRDFVRLLVSQEIKFDHVVMNLPGSAVEFLDVFVNLFPAAYTGKMPMIHVYTFVKGDPRTEADKMIEYAKTAVEKYLKVTDKNEIIYNEIFNVRDVSHKKQMLCVSFRLPESVGLQNNKRKLQITEQIQETDTKKSRKAVCCEER